MGQDPDAIRAEIEQTRDEMSGTVEALGYKADVPTRTKENIQGKVDSVKSKLTGATDRISDATPNSGDVKAKGKQAVGVAQSNPIGLAIGGLAAGFLAGMLIPSTKIEDERVGPIADQVKETAAETGQEAIERGREVASQVAEQAVEGAKEVGQEAMETAKEAGQEQAEELKDSAKEGAEEVKERART